MKAVADASLKRLGIGHIDLFYQHRVDPNVPIEVGAMADLPARAGPRTSLRPSVSHRLSRRSVTSVSDARPAPGHVELDRELGLEFLVGRTRTSSPRMCLPECASGLMVPRYDVFNQCSDGCYHLNLRREGMSISLEGAAQVFREAMRETI